MTYQDALDWMESFYDIDDYESYEDFIDDVRSEFQNENLIDSIETEIQMMYESHQY